jgi:tetratricopeptide (TPR) repeat protein
MRAADKRFFWRIKRINLYFIEMKKTLAILLLSFLVSSCSIIAKKQGEELNQKGLDYLSTLQYREAVNCFKGVSSMSFIDTETKVLAYRNEAIAHSYLAEIDSARQCFLAAAELNDKKSYAYLVNISDVYIIDKKIDKAIGCLKQAITYKKDDFMVYNNLGLIYLGEYGPEYMDYDKALFYNKKVYEMTPDITTKYTLAQSYYRKEEYPAAEKYFTELLEAAPENTDYMIYQVYVKEGLKKTDEVEALKAKIKKLKPEVYESYFGEVME